ncbi:hypothetical protein [Microbulbifer sp. JTAC008]|uniref:hypothetical protein n=1 Tax=unclassified Microbulbifer TaxID=2619833 RepID=UPI00403A7080
MDQIPRDEIGYMQVQFKIFKSGDEYDVFGINAFDECFCTERNMVSTQHQVVDDEAKVYEKIFQIKLVLKASNYIVMMHMPIHQSEEWEFLGEYEDYEIYFYCILGQNTSESMRGGSEQESPNKLLHRIKKSFAFLSR